MKQNDLCHVVAALLDSLGQTADEIAEQLNTCKIQGARNATRFLNPVVRYVQVSIKSEAIDMDVIPRDTLRICFAKNTYLHVALPPPVIDFINRFNAGHYPEMELDDSDLA
jgi:hypothetical protein